MVPEEDGCSLSAGGLDEALTVMTSCGYPRGRLTLYAIPLKILGESGASACVFAVIEQ